VNEIKALFNCLAAVCDCGAMIQIGEDRETCFLAIVFYDVNQVTGTDEFDFAMGGLDDNGGVEIFGSRDYGLNGFDVGGVKGAYGKMFPFCFLEIGANIHRFTIACVNIILWLPK